MNAFGPATKDKLLFTPGPLTTSASVKEAMQHDAGSWDGEFNSLVAGLRQRLLQVAGLTRETGWEAVPLQGCGTYGVEAVFQTCVPSKGKVAVLANGAYGTRMEQILDRAGIDHVVLRTPEDSPVHPEEVSDLLLQVPSVTHVAVVHCETTSGLLNPIECIGQVVRAHKKVYIVDATSSFGAIPIDFEESAIDFLVGSPNKCLEGVPGFCFVLCRREVLERCEGQARSLSLDLLAQLKGFDTNGQFRFTPPTHALLALNQALDELEQEGGISARAERYRLNHQILLQGMGGLGLRPFLKPEVQSYVITAFGYPQFPGFSFEGLYRRLSRRGFLIYPGKLSETKTFRIGTIGHLFPGDFQRLVQAIAAELTAMETQQCGSLKAETAIEPANK